MNSRDYNKVYWQIVGDDAKQLDKLGFAIEDFLDRLLQVAQHKCATVFIQASKQQNIKAVDRSRRQGNGGRAARKTRSRPDQKRRGPPSDGQGEYDAKLLGWKGGSKKWGQETTWGELLEFDEGRDYVAWALNNWEDMNDDLRVTLETELARDHVTEPSGAPDKQLFGASALEGNDDLPF